jgi:hypothetical protein
MRVSNSLWILVLLCPLVGLSETRYRTIKTHQPDPADNHFFLEIVDGQKVVKKIPCIAHDTAADRCDAFPLPNQTFILVDCYTHDAVAMNCVLKHFTNQGVEDTQFKTPVIGIVDKLRFAPTNPKIWELSGTFDDPQLDGIGDFERNFCLATEEECSGWRTQAVLRFDWDGKLLSTQVIKSAAPPYSDEQMETELTRLISEQEQTVQSGTTPPRDLEEYRKLLQKIRDRKKKAVKAQ